MALRWMVCFVWWCKCLGSSFNVLYIKCYLLRYPLMFNVFLWVIVFICYKLLIWTIKKTYFKLLIIYFRRSISFGASHSWRSAKTRQARRAQRERAENNTGPLRSEFHPRLHEGEWEREREIMREKETIKCVVLTCFCCCILTSAQMHTSVNPWLGTVFW